MKKLVYILLFLACPASVFAGQQGDSAVYVTLSGNVFGNKTLAAGKYLVKSNLRIAKDAVLTIEAGSEMVFNPGAEIVVLGGINIKGKPGKLVNLYSINGAEEGIGFTITGENAGASIVIDYASFNGLIRPITFANKWYRSGVSITNSQFMNITNNDAGIVIQDAEYLKNTKTIRFDFTGNIFADNYSTISFSSFSSFNVQYTFSDNLVYNNWFFDYKPRVKSNPVNGQLDEDKTRHLIIFRDNVIMNNYVLHDESDTLIDYAGIGLEGTAVEFSAGENYWGNMVTEELAKKQTFGFNKDKFNPEIQVSPYLTTPPDRVKAFVTHALLAGSLYNNKTPVTDFIGKEITLHFSKPLAASQSPVLTAVYLDTSIGKVLRQPVTDFTFSYTNGSRSAKLTVPKVEGIEHAFYLEISALTDEEGFELPRYSFGNFYMHTIYGQYKNNLKINLELFYANAALWKQLPDKENIETVDPQYKKLAQKKYTWELGAMMGVTNYFGDLSSNDFNRDEINYAYGLRARYNFHKRYSLRGMLTFAHLSGSDRHADEPYRRNRSLAFRSAIYDLTVAFEYHLNYYQFTEKNRFVPSISAGLSVFRFNPRANYNGTWYDLQPI
ncbi:MAG TPA: DUF6089 family protein, partial [Bacteroidia bacterium]|nr:DUF6089 family protein [Bacteroidia bacterium]